MNGQTLYGTVWWGRIASCLYVVLLIVLYRPPVNSSGVYPVSALYAALGALVVVNAVAWRFGEALSSRFPRRWPAALVAVDATATITVVAVMTVDPGIPAWVLFALPMMEIAVLAFVPGAVCAWVGVTVVYGILQYTALGIHGYSLKPLAMLHHVSLLFVVSFFMARLSHALTLRNRQVDALKSVAAVTQRMTSMDASTLVDELTVAARKVGFTDIQMFTVTGDPAYWSLALGTKPEDSVDEAPGDVHLWCTDLAERIGDRSRPMYMRPQDAMSSYRYLDWGKTQVLVAPVRSGTDLFAIIVATHPDPIPGYRKKTLQLLASHAGAALANARRYAERQRYERRLAHQATHDALTRLPNRVLLHTRLTTALKRAAGTGARTAVLLLDLDRFKEINDTLGHDYGDHLLRQVSERLAAIMRTGDVAARLGGDEFAVLITGLQSVDDAVAMAGRVLTGVHQPFIVDGVTLDVEVSIGVAVSPEHGDTVEDLMRCADVAMYHAKRGTLGVSVYDSANDEHTPKKLALLGDMRRALETREQLLLHYQPAIDTATGTIVGAEALLRWDHPHHGLVNPSQFVPGAEGTGLIHALTRYALEAAMDQARSWKDMGYEIPVAVNLSTRVLMDYTLPDQLSDVLRERGLSPASVRLEITESSIMSDPERALAVLEKLSDLGVPLSIDDFGTGYSSMTYLKRLPVDEIKIDQSFVRDMVGQPKDAMLVRSLIELGHNLGLKVVAEGVEDARTLDALRELRCDVAQGFYISRPMESVDFDAWIAGARRGPVARG